MKREVRWKKEKKFVMQTTDLIQSGWYPGCLVFYPSSSFFPLKREWCSKHGESAHPSAGGCGTFHTRKKKERKFARAVKKNVWETDVRATKGESFGEGVVFFLTSSLLDLEFKNRTEFVSNRRALSFFFCSLFFRKQIFNLL